MTATTTTTTTTSSRVHRTRPVASSTASRVHHASLVHPATHSPMLLKLVNSRLSLKFIDYIANFIADALDSADGLPASPLGNEIKRRFSIVGLKFFMNMLFARTQVPTPVILAALAFIDKAKHQFETTILQELPLERTFLSAIVVASKALNDHTKNNIYWERCSAIFRAKEISCFELEFLTSLRWNLRLSDNDIFAHYDAICIHTFTDVPTRNRSAPHQQPQERYSNTRVPNDCAKLQSHSSLFPANKLSSSKVSHSSYNPSRASKPKSPFRRWIKFFHIRSRHSTTTSIPVSV